MSGSVNLNPLLPDTQANPLLDQQALQATPAAWGGANAQTPMGSLQWSLRPQPNGSYLILRSPANSSSWENAGSAANMTEAQRQLRLLQGLYGGQLVP